MHNQRIDYHYFFPSKKGHRVRKLHINILKLVFNSSIWNITTSRLLLLLQIFLQNIIMFLFPGRWVVLCNGYCSKGIPTFNQRTPPFVVILSLRFDHTVVTLNPKSIANRNIALATMAILMHGVFTQHGLENYFEKSLLKHRIKHKLKNKHIIYVLSLYSLF